MTTRRSAAPYRNTRLESVFLLLFTLERVFAIRAIHSSACPKFVARALCNMLIDFRNAYLRELSR